MGITLEKIDLIRSRANVTYEDAKIALEQCHFDEIEALIYLEKNRKTRTNTSEGVQKTQTVNPSLWEQLKEIIFKMHEIRFVVEKNKIVIINIPLTFFIVTTIFLSPFVIPLILLGLIFGYRIAFVKSETESYEVNGIFDSTLEKVKVNTNTNSHATTYQESQDISKNTKKE